MSFYVGTILRFPQQRFSAAQEKKTKEKGEKEEKFRNVVETILRLCCFLFFILFFSLFKTTFAKFLHKTQAIGMT